MNRLKLVKIIDLYNQKVDDKRREKLSSMVVTDSLPKNLPNAEDVVKKFLAGEIDPSETIYCLAKVEDLYSSPIYNRPEEIDLNKCEQHLYYQGGFSHRLAGSQSAWFRPSGHLVNTQGGHRTTKKYAVTLEGETRVLIGLKFHPPHATEDQIILAESEDHHTDAAFRKNQTGDNKFKSAYHSNQSWAVDLFEYLKPFSIGIAGTLEGAEFTLPSHSYMSTAINLADKSNVSRYLKAFTEHKCEKVILGNCVVAGALFLKHFGAYIQMVDKENNGCDSFSSLLNYYFNIYGVEEAFKMVDPDAKPLTQAELCAGNGVYKGNEPATARFVFLYNDFVRIKRLKIRGHQKTAIPFEGSKSTAWNEFLLKANPLMKPALKGLAETKFF